MGDAILRNIFGDWCRIDLPTIKSVGLPPEKHSDRIVGEMLRVIVTARQQSWSRIHAVLNNSAVGNPKAQAKLVAKLKEAARPFMIGVHLQPGKRGSLSSRVCVPRWLECRDQTDRDADDPIPETPWLALSIITLTSKGNHRCDKDGGVALLITHHALSRLAQRCGARTQHSNVIHAAMRSPFNTSRIKAAKSSATICA